MPRPSPADRLDTLPPGIPTGPTLGYGVAAWAETWLRQPDGPRARRRFRLTARQLRFLLWWYALDDDWWMFSKAVRRQAKGSGKSPFAAVLALAELCGPVRPARTDPKVLGGVIGGQVDMPLVQIAATAESQTANTMRFVRAFAPKGSAVVQAHNLDVGKTVYYRAPEGGLEVITASYTAAEGAQCTCVIGDETEHWRAGNGGIALAATLEDNLAKSGSRMVQTENAWVPGTGTVAEASWDAWCAQEEGRTRGDGLVLYDALVAPPDVDLADEAQLRAALEHVYGDCDWKRPQRRRVDPVTGDEDIEPVPGTAPDIRPILNRIWRPDSHPDDSRRKYLNRPTVHVDAWATPDDWSLLADTTRAVTADEAVVLFFDGSRSRDATALIGCCVDDGHIFTCGIWEPDPAHTTADQVPVAAVEHAVAAAFDRHHVVAFFADVAEWESQTKVTWPAAYAAALELAAVPGGADPQQIAWDMRSHTLEFTRAVELTEAEIRDGGFSHDGHAALARHVANARRRPNRWGVSIGKESPSSPRKIDAAVAMIGARMVRRLYLAARADGGGRRARRPGRVIAWS